MIKFFYNTRAKFEQIDYPLLTANGQKSILNFFYLYAKQLFFNEFEYNT